MTHRPTPRPTRRLGLAIASVLLAAACADVTNSDPSGSAIICFGDSLTAGTGAAPEDAYPAQLARRIGREVVNAGVPGDTTSSALARLETDVLDRDPRIVIITLGGNDLMQGVDATDAFAHLTTIVERIQDRGALVVIGGLEPPIHDRGYSDGYAKLSDELGCILVDDLLGGIMGHDELMSDQIHPNGKGYAKLAARFEDAIAPYL